MRYYNNEIIEFPVSVVVSSKHKMDNKELLAKAEKISNADAVDIIQAHMLELPITPILYQWTKTDKETIMSFLTKYEVIIAYRRYIKNKFPILISGKQKYFDQLNDDELSKFWFTGIKCLQLKHSEDNPNFVYYMEKF